MEPSWDQVATKPEPTSNQKNDQLLVGFRKGLGWILAPKLEGPGGVRKLTFWRFVGSWGHLGAKTAPRAPKKPQEAPKTASKTDFGTILVDFWLIFWWFFGWFGGSFRLLLLVVVLVCCLVGLLVCWSVGSLLCWFSGLLVVCLSAVWPQSPRHGGGRPEGQLDNATNV